MANLTAIQVFQLCGFAVLLVAGQILFKVVSQTAPPLTSLPAFLSLGFNVWFWLSMALYGTATLLWLYILQNVALSQAYPFVALGFILVPLASWLFFKEPLNLTYVLGVGLIIVGLGFITRA